MLFKGQGLSTSSMHHDQATRSLLHRIPADSTPGEMEPRSGCIPRHGAGMRVSVQPVGLMQARTVKLAESRTVKNGSPAVTR